MVVFFVLSISLLVLSVQAQPPQFGDYEVAVTDYEIPEVLDSTDPRVVVVYPTGGNFTNASLPMLIYSHGCGGGGPLTYIGYKNLLDGMASFGWVVLAPRSCFCGCDDGGDYFEEALSLIRWSQTMTTDPILHLIDHSLGYAIAGHSYGGQATAEAAKFAIEYNIKSAIVHHPAATNGRGIQCPLAGYTGTEDNCCGEDATMTIWNPAPEPKVFANMIGAAHVEPNLPSVSWTAYTIAWAEIFVRNDRGYFYDLIFNQANANSLCGGNIPMETCILYAP